jgi:hypothetical protein
MSKIRIFHALSIYSGFIDSVYRKNPDLSNLSYIEQQNILMNAGFGWINVWKINLEKTGLFEVETVFTNAEIMQKSWAEENNIRYSNKNWLQDILFSQINNNKPDIFFAHDAINISPVLSKIKNDIPTIKLIFGWDGILAHNPTLFTGYDLILSCVKESTEFYQKFGFKTYYFQFGFETEILNKINIRKQVYDLTFVGSLYPQGQHKTRFELMNDIKNNFYLNLWTPSFNYKYFWIYYKHQLQRLLSGNFDEYQDVKSIIKLNKGEVYGIEMFQVLSDSKITLNSHITKSKNESANIRLYEATGMGACLVTDWKENLNTIFDIDNEVVTYNSNAECVEKIKFLLNNEPYRKKIALAGQKRTLREHNYENRFKLFSDFLLNLYSEN